MLSKETYLKPRDTYRLEVAGEKKILHANGDQSKVEVSRLVSSETDFNIKTVVTDKEGHCIMIKGSIQDVILTYMNPTKEHLKT